MAGMNFQYDETGSTFYYFLVSFYALVLIPFTFWVFRKDDDEDSKDKDRNICHCEPCQAKNRRLHASKPKKKLLQKVLYVIVIIGWIVFIWAAYKVAQIKTDHVEYDPYEVLGVDRGASDKDIRKQYRELSRVHHPDRSGGDETHFMRIAKAYAALTNEESRKNWEEYGNPDGPGAMQFGIALPKWLVEGNTSVWVLMSYVLVFMIILPAVVGTWWYKSIKYSGDKILLPTTQLYYYFINKTPNMIFKRAFMILAASFEFWMRHNNEIVERPTDDEEVRQLMRDVNSTYLNEKNREQPLCLPYSIKARALLLAHMQQIHLPAATLQQDLLYVLGRSPTLINEMVQICAQLTAMSKMGQAAKPRLETLENIMKMSPLLVQGLWENSSPLLMLPHIAEQQLKHFINKKRSIRNIKQFCQLSDEDRRGLVKHLEDQEYMNIINTLRSLPAVTMECDMKVLDDEDNSITANSIVTVLVKLKRENMLDRYGTGVFPLSSTPAEWALTDTTVVEGDDAEVEAHKEDQEEQEEVEEEKKKTTKVWEKNKSKKSKGGKKKKPAASVPYKPKSKQNGGPVTAPIEANDKKVSEDHEEDDDDVDDDERVEKAESGDGVESVDKSEKSEKDSEDESDLDEEHNIDSAPMPEYKHVDADEEWEEIDNELHRSGNKLETTSLISHSVHCPFFTDDKQEYWWLYLCDKKKSDLVTVPVRITNLVDELEIDVKFPAPKKTGIYTYTMCLKSDSYIDMDLAQNLKFDVKEAKVIENHPQWDISSDEEEGSAGSNEDYDSEDDESEFEYDDD